MEKDELIAHVAHLKLRAQAERYLRIAAPAHTHGNVFTGAAAELASKQRELDEASERVDAQEFYEAYLAHHHARAYADAGAMDDDAVADLEALFPVLADLRK